MNAHSIWRAIGLTAITVVAYKFGHFVAKEEAKDAGH